MLAYVLRRIIGLIFVILGVTFITFAMGYLAPGEDPISAILGTHNTPAAHAALAHYYGLDRPWYEQYGSFLTNMLHGSFGLSYAQQGTPVTEIIGPKIMVSLQLGFWALVLALVIGIPAGIFAALRRDSAFDTIIMSIMLFFYAIPNFVLIPFFAVSMVFLYQRGIPSLPVTGWSDGLEYKIAPITILGLTTMGYFARLSRTLMLEVLNQDYVRTARAKGLAENKVIFVHAFRNAMLPLVSVIGPSLAYIVTGAFVIEYLFNIPGIGYQSVHSIPQRDWPIVQATVVILAVAVVAMNFLTDIVYGVVDPRIRIAEGG